jgi:hypothetical protein
MSTVPHPRGLALLVAHIAAFDPATVTARERLDDALGPVLARKLVFALTGGGQARERRERADGFLDDRAVFAA